MTVAAPSSNGASNTNRLAAPRPFQRPTSALELIRTADRAEVPPTGTHKSATDQQTHPAQPSGFSPEQLAALAAPLDRANVRQREQGRGKVAYLEGWQVIAEANRIFGFDGWQRQTIAVRCVAQAERPIGRDQKPGWGVTYTARVRVTVTAGGRPPLIREGSGAGHGIDVDLGQAHESAIKEAETDAMKRALMTFGNPFGLALYDKQQRQVSTAGGQVEGPQRPAAGASDQPGRIRSRQLCQRPLLSKRTSRPRPPLSPDRYRLTPARWRSILRRSSSFTTRSGPCPGPCWRACSVSGSRCPTPQ